jgi:hypothetical protein
VKNLVSKLTIIKILLFLGGIIFMLVWTKISDENLKSIWVKNNNMNPIKCSISSEIDSIAREGRGFFLKLNSGGKFIFKAKMYESENLLPDVSSMVDIGDSVYKKQNSEIMMIKKKTSQDTIFFDLYTLDYGDLGCKY